MDVILLSFIYTKIPMRQLYAFIRLYWVRPSSIKHEDGEISLSRRKGVKTSGELLPLDGESPVHNPSKSPVPSSGSSWFGSGGCTAGLPDSAFGG
jgi:hypothetical protein